MNQDFLTDLKKRRKQYLQKTKDGLSVFFAPTEKLRNGDVLHPFRQESNFFYLTGFEESHSMSLLCAASPSPFQLFVHPKDPKRELWEGKLLGPDKTKTLYAVDSCGPSIPGDAFEAAFIEALCQPEVQVLYYKLGLEPTQDALVLKLMYQAQRKLGRTGRPLWPIVDPDTHLGEMRLFKSSYEIKMMREAGRISAEGHVEVMKQVRPGQFEYEMDALLLNEFKKRGAMRLGYDSIVASGENACVLHYRSNNRQMKAGDLLLVDAGAEYEYFSGDITRVCPVNGKFTPAQRKVYSAVLNAQKKCIAATKPGVTFESIHELAVRTLTEELVELKILKGDVKKLIETRGFFDYYPHRTGHWLGLDVHDSGRYFAKGGYHDSRKLEPGMVFTIEPGLYFGTKGPKEFLGIGVRIEDDILVTSKGCEVLTAGVPKEIEEIESLWGQK